GRKSYSDDKISEIVFKENFKNVNEWKEYLKKSLFLSKQYIEFISENITIKNIKTFSHTLTSLVIDLEWLLCNFEVSCLKSHERISLMSGRRKNLTPTDIHSAAWQIFRIEEATDINDLYLRDIKPIVMFQIRQMLEIFGRNIIG